MSLVSLPENTERNNFIPPKAPPTPDTNTPFSINRLPNELFHEIFDIILTSEKSIANLDRINTVANCIETGLFSLFLKQSAMAKEFIDNSQQTPSHEDPIDEISDFSRLRKSIYMLTEPCLLSCHSLNLQKTLPFDQRSLIDSLDFFVYPHFKHTERLAIFRQLPNLKKLFLHKLPLTASELIETLNTLPRLEELSIRKCTGLDKETSLSPKINSSITYINFGHSDIHLQLIAKIWNSSPKLGSLLIYGCQKVHSAFSPHFHPNPNIFSLNLCGSSVTSLNLGTLWNASPNLNVIDLSYCRSIHRGAQPSLKQHTSLQKVCWDHSSVTKTIFMNIHNAASNLKNTAPEAYSNSHFSFFPNYCDLLHLDSVSIFNSVMYSDFSYLVKRIWGRDITTIFSPDIFSLIWNKTTKIKNFEAAENHQFIPGPIQPLKTNPDIKRIEILSKDFPSSWFSSIFTAAPNAKVFDYWPDVSYDEQQPIENLDMPSNRKLKIISIGLPLNFKQFINLWNSCPIAERITVRLDSNVNLSTIIPSLEERETLLSLEIYANQVRISEVEILKSKAPNAEITIHNKNLNFTRDIDD